MHRPATLYALALDRDAADLAVETAEAARSAAHVRLASGLAEAVHAGLDLSAAAAACRLSVDDAEKLIESLDELTAGVLLDGIAGAAPTPVEEGVYRDLMVASGDPAFVDRFRVGLGEAFRRPGEPVSVRLRPIGAEVDPTGPSRTVTATCSCGHLAGDHDAAGCGSCGCPETWR